MAYRDTRQAADRTRDDFAAFARRLLADIADPASLPARQSPNLLCKIPGYTGRCRVEPPLSIACQVRALKDKEKFAFVALSRPEGVLTQALLAMPSRKTTADPYP